jgi:DNA-binding transcriptional ArsR family regulator
MGGRTWEKKDLILEALYQGWLNGQCPTGTELASICERALSTISTHLSELAEQGYVEEGPSRKRWRLSAKGHGYIHSRGPRQATLKLLGVIAAGPSIPIGDAAPEELPITEFDPDTHFALRVRGNSMVGEGILNGALIICRAVSAWLDAPSGSIVAVRVPEGTGEDGPGWLEALDRAVYQEGMSQPSLTHTTLKKLDASFHAYLQQGEARYRAGIRLKGTRMTFPALAVEVYGYVVESRNRHV